MFPKEVVDLSESTVVDISSDDPGQTSFDVWDQHA